ncbi:MazG family protein [Actinoallomurus rhizosphaericola]|uniref:MazG family protein n=1 Tax=Actinoallomurus rhizosphaericola TaxID=2952536 RepID=UPI002090DC39|nr:MazG family protein [Actinoallomurus rhizosphaericola]MCO5992776.1 MazG family protein [Actinoallomurus rhizosphaericola]
MPGLTFLASSSRVAPGQLTWPAWETLRGADRVLTGSGEHPQLPYVRDAGVAVEVVEPDAAALVREASTGTVVWLAGLDGDEDLMRAVGSVLVGMDEPPQVEVVQGAYDLPGARFLDLVAVMDTLRRECPWDREQTHESLAPYLLEEAYEVIDLIESGDLKALREELGDVLMQVVFHAQVSPHFDVDDVAEGITDKLVRRNPHVFGDVTVADADEVDANWNAIKLAERGEDASIFHGVPMAQPSLSLAAQLQRRAAKADVPEELFADDGVGADLFALVRRLREEGRDPEAELRAAARRFHDRVERHQGR